MHRRLICNEPSAHLTYDSGLGHGLLQILHTRRAVVPPSHKAVVQVLSSRTHLPVTTTALPSYPRIRVQPISHSCLLSAKSLSLCHLYRLPYLLLELTPQNPVSQSHLQYPTAGPHPPSPSEPHHHNSSPPHHHPSSPTPLTTTSLTPPQIPSARGKKRPRSVPALPSITICMCAAAMPCVLCLTCANRTISICTPSVHLATKGSAARAG
ncbi:hypothetical protein P154DRAFT_65642 [Amniculicola lignicola CBS 123094]|uniref:Uncharacterized protein n=1 Tax=Amniculicola lignicola CBS 123094 TaxID=1392246 RepID=A0A6A5WTF4_9PLEO|nr:hypothetical protein P154DRAFT_65642 [Amniculicola lignicola CBS 123094]